MPDPIILGFYPPPPLSPQLGYINNKAEILLSLDFSLGPAGSMGPSFQMAKLFVWKYF